jgi:hypothetical protein
MEGFEFNGREVKPTCAFLVGAEPAPVPGSPKFSLYRIPRIQATTGPSGLDDWLNRFEAGEVKVFVQPMTGWSG